LEKWWIYVVMSESIKGRVEGKKRCERKDGRVRVVS